ncbi:MAG: hypothetical protein ACRDAP_01170 [Shewanella sp.]
MAVPPPGGGAPPTAAAGAAGGPPDPRRPKPDDIPMTKFLIQIGNEHPPAQQDANRRYVEDKEKQIEEALKLGDIKQSGTTQTHQLEPGEGPEWGGNYPIYDFIGPQHSTTHAPDVVRFSLDPRCGDASFGMVPHIEHQIGQVHEGMSDALWAAFCFDNPGPDFCTEANYYALLRGLAWRYAPDGQPPQFVP